MIVQRKLFQHKQLWLYVLFFRCVHSLTTTDNAIEEMRAAKRMIKPYVNTLNERLLVLASDWQRWRDTVKDLGLDVIACPSTLEGLPRPRNISSFEKSVVDTARSKVLAVWNLMKGGPGTFAPLRLDLVFGADMMICVDDCSSGKSVDKNDMKEMLKKLSNSISTVVTAVAVQIRNKTVLTYTEQAKVHFSEFTKEFMDKFVASNYKMYIANTFAPQLLLEDVVKKVEGEYYTAVGMPLKRLVKILIEFAISVRH